MCRRTGELFLKRIWQSICVVSTLVTVLAFEVYLHAKIHSPDDVDRANNNAIIYSPSSMGLVEVGKSVKFKSLCTIGVLPERILVI